MLSPLARPAAPLASRDRAGCRRGQEAWQGAGVAQRSFAGDEHRAPLAKRPDGYAHPADAETRHRAARQLLTTARLHAPGPLPLREAGPTHEEAACRGSGDAEALHAAWRENVPPFDPRPQPTASGDQFLVDALLEEVRATALAPLKPPALLHPTPHPLITLPLLPNPRPQTFNPTQVQSLKTQLLGCKDREASFRVRVLELQRERDGLQALWDAERQRQAVLQEAMTSTLEYANAEMRARLTYNQLGR